MRRISKTDTKIKYVLLKISGKMQRRKELEHFAQNSRDVVPTATRRTIEGKKEYPENVRRQVL